MCAWQHDDVRNCTVRSVGSRAGPPASAASNGRSESLCPSGNRRLQTEHDRCEWRVVQRFVGMPYGFAVLPAVSKRARAAIAVRRDCAVPRSSASDRDSARTIRAAPLRFLNIEALEILQDEPAFFGR